MARQNDSGLPVEYTFTVVFEPSEEGGYTVSFPAIPDLATQGETLEEARTMALDAELDADARNAEAVLQEAEKIASESDCKIEGEILQARDAGHAIVDEALERGVSAIAIGVDYQMPLGELELSATAHYVMDHAPCQVIVVREAAREVGE